MIDSAPKNLAQVESEIMKSIAKADYQPKAAMAPYMTTAAFTAKTVPANIAIGTSIKAVRDAAVLKDSFYKIVNKDSNQSVLRWGDQIKADGNVKGTDAYRYFKIV